MDSVIAQKRDLKSNRVYEKSFCGNVRILCCSFKVEHQDDLVGKYFKKQKSRKIPDGAERPDKEIS